MTKRSLILFLLCPLGIAVVAAICLVMLISIGFRDWRPVEATVLNTEIESTRAGTLQWSLMADFIYEVDGTAFEKRRVDVFHSSDRTVTEAEQREWPAGKRFTVYYARDNPGMFSTHIDGGFEATAVIVVLLGGAASVSLLPWLFYWWRKKKTPAG